MVTFVVGVDLAFLVARSRFWGREGLDAALHPAPGAAAHGPGLLPHRPDRAPGLAGPLAPGNLGDFPDFYLAGSSAGRGRGVPPLIFKSARAAFEEVDPDLEDVGPHPGPVGGCGLFPGVPAPRLAGILAGAMMAFARAMGEFGATLTGGRQPPRQDPNPVPWPCTDAVQAGKDVRSRPSW